MLALGNSSAKEEFSTIKSKVGEQLAGCWYTSAPYHIPHILESPDAVYLLHATIVESLATDLATL